MSRTFLCLFRLRFQLETVAIGTCCHRDVPPRDPWSCARCTRRRKVRLFEIVYAYPTESFAHPSGRTETTRSRCSRGFAARRSKLRRRGLFLGRSSLLARRTAAPGLPRPPQIASPAHLHQFGTSPTHSTPSGLAVLTTVALLAVFVVSCTSARTPPPRHRRAERTTRNEHPRGVRESIRRGRLFDVFIGIFDKRAIPPLVPAEFAADQRDIDTPYQQHLKQVPEAFGRCFDGVDVWSLSLHFRRVRRVRSCGTRFELS